MQHSDGAGIDDIEPIAGIGNDADGHRNSRGIIAAAVRSSRRQRASTLTANGAYTHSDARSSRTCRRECCCQQTERQRNGSLAGALWTCSGGWQLAPATRYTILNASAAGGGFGSVTSTSRSDADARICPTNVFLTLARNDIDFAAVAFTPNQRQVSNALDQATAATAAGTWPPSSTP